MAFTVLKKPVVMNLWNFERSKAEVHLKTPCFKGIWLNVLRLLKSLPPGVFYGTAVIENNVQIRSYTNLKKAMWVEMAAVKRRVYVHSHITETMHYYTDITAARQAWN